MKGAVEIIFNQGTPKGASPQNCIGLDQLGLFIDQGPPYRAPLRAMVGKVSSHNIDFELGAAAH